MSYLPIFKNTLKIAIIGCIALAPFAVQAKSLAEAINASWKNHPSMKAAAAKTGYSYRERQEEFSAYLPDLSLSASGGRQFADNATSRGINTVRGEGYSGIWDGSASLRQNFYDGGGRNSRVAAAEAREKSAAINVLDVKDVLASSVAASYIELLRVYQNLSAMAAHRAEMQDYLARITAATEEGAVDDNEYRQALDINLSIEGIISQLTAQLKTAEAAYYEAVGEMPTGELETPLLPSSAIPENVTDALAAIDNAHPALQRSKYDALSAARQIDSEKSAFYPVVDGELSYTKSEKRDIIGGEAEDAKAVMRMNWNFETGGAVFHRISKKKFYHEETLARAKELKRQIERSVRLGYAEYEAAIENLEIQARRNQLFRDLYQTYQDQFEGARVSLLQLMQAKNQMFLSDIDQVDAQHRVLNAQYAILSAMGRTQSVASPVAHELGAR